MGRKKNSEPAMLPNGEPKPVESREQKLSRLAPRRVSNAIKAIRRIGLLGSYKPTDSQRQHIVDALMSEVEAVNVRLSNVRQREVEFNFPGS